jgi:hypothetical protein
MHPGNGDGTEAEKMQSGNGGGTEVEKQREYQLLGEIQVVKFTANPAEVMPLG